MVLCMFASCNSNNRINRGLKFFRVPYSKQPGVAKLWLSRSKRADLSFKDLVASSHYVVCEKHFSPSQLEPYSFGDERRCRVREGELPIPDKQQIVTTIMRAQQSRKKSRNEAAVIVCEDYPGYTGVMFVYNRITQHMIVQWTGLEVDTQTKTDTEQSLLSLFKAGTAESHLKVVNVRSGGDVCISKENVEMGDINVLQAKVKDEPTDILVDISSFGGTGDAPPLDMSDDGATTHLRMERVVTDVTVDTVSRVSADHTYVTDESARAKQANEKCAMTNPWTLTLVDGSEVDESTAEKIQNLEYLEAPCQVKKDTNKYTLPACWPNRVADYLKADDDVLPSSKVSKFLIDKLFSHLVTYHVEKDYPYLSRNLIKDLLQSLIEEHPKLRSRLPGNDQIHMLLSKLDTRFIKLRKQLVKSGAAPPVVFNNKAIRRGIRKRPPCTPPTEMATAARRTPKKAKDCHSLVGNDVYSMLARSRAERFATDASLVMERWPALKDVDTVTHEWKDILREFYPTLQIPSKDISLTFSRIFPSLSDQLEDRLARYQYMKKVKAFLDRISNTEESKIMKTFMCLPIALGDNPSTLYRLSESQEIGPHMLIDMRDCSLYVNRKRICTYSSFLECIVSHFMLHHVLNLEYGAEKTFTVIEVMLGVQDCGRAKFPIAVKSFLATYNVCVDD